MDEANWLRNLIDRYDDGRWHTEQRNREVDEATADLNAAYTDDRVLSINTRSLVPRQDLASELKSKFSDHITSLSRICEYLNQFYTFDLSRFKLSNSTDLKLEQMSDELEFARTVMAEVERTMGQSESQADNALELLKQAEAAGSNQ